MQSRCTPRQLFWLVATSLLVAACGDEAGLGSGPEPDGWEARPVPGESPTWTLDPPADEPREPSLVGQPALPESDDAVLGDAERPITELPAPPSEVVEPSTAPVAVARVRVDDGGESAWAGELELHPLTRIQLDGGQSAGGSGVTRWDWWVMEYPIGGLGAFEPSAEAVAPYYFITTAGSYQFALRVWDEDSEESENVGVVKITAVYDQGIVVEMTWDTPGDPNPLDFGGGNGTDVDLHFLHPNGQWNVAPWDCYWSNKSPNWGAPSPPDDPSLDIDDTDGWGPETIRLDYPEGTLDLPFTYKVGAFTFSDHGFGPSDVTLRVFIDGVERATSTFNGLQNRQFWDAFRISWPSGDIERIDRLYPSGFP